MIRVDISSVTIISYTNRNFCVLSFQRVLGIFYENKADSPMIWIELQNLKSMFQLKNFSNDGAFINFDKSWLRTLKWGCSLKICLEYDLYGVGDFKRVCNWKLPPRWDLYGVGDLKSCHHAEMHYECTVLADVAPPLTNWLRLQQTFPSQFHKCHQMLWRRGEWTLGPQTTPLSLVDLCHCL